MELYLPATHQSSLGLMSRRVQQLQPSSHTVFPITGMSCFIDGWISTEASMRHSATYYYPNQCPCLGRFMTAVREVLRGKWSPFWTAGEGDGLWISRWANKQLCFGINVGCVNSCTADRELWQAWLLKHARIRYKAVWACSVSLFIYPSCTTYRNFWYHKTVLFH